MQSCRIEWKRLILALYQVRLATPTIRGGFPLPEVEKDTCGLPFLARCDCRCHNHRGPRCACYTTRTDHATLSLVPCPTRADRRRASRSLPPERVAGEPVFDVGGNGVRLACAFRVQRVHSLSFQPKRPVPVSAQFFRQQEYQGNGPCRRLALLPQIMSCLIERRHLRKTPFQEIVIMRS